MRKPLSRVRQYSVKGAMLVGILLSPLMALVAMILILDAFKFGLSSFTLLGYGIILLTFFAGFRLIRAKFRVRGAARWLAWIALLGGHLAAVNLARVTQDVSQNSAISANSCRQVIAAIAQFCHEEPRREWIYHDDIVGRYIGMIVHTDADEPTENFPFHWDEQEYVVTMNNGYKVIMWSDVPLRELGGDVYTFAQRPNGKLHRGSISGDEEEAWPHYLEWKRKQTPVRPPAND